jgi:hypothetical protein
VTMNIVSNQRRLTGLMAIAGAVVMLAVAAAIYAGVVPSCGLRREILALTLAAFGVIDVLIGLVFVIRS